MKKFLSILLVVLLSGVVVFASGVFDDDPPRNPPGGNDPTTPVLVTEVPGTRPPVNRPGPNNPPLHCYAMSVRDAVTGHISQIRIGLGMSIEAPLDHNDPGTYAFYLYIDTPLSYPVQVVYVNQTTGETYYVTLEAGTTCCWVPIGNAQGSWMVQFGSDYGYYTVINDLFYGMITLQ